MRSQKSCQWIPLYLEYKCADTFAVLNGGLTDTSSLPQFMSVIRSPARLIYERNFFQGAARHRARHVFPYFRDFCGRQVSRKFTMNGNESKLGRKSSRASGKIVKIAERAKPKRPDTFPLISSRPPSLLPSFYKRSEFYRNSTRETKEVTMLREHENLPRHSNAPSSTSEGLTGDM